VVGWSVDEVTLQINSRNTGSEHLAHKRIAGLQYVKENSYFPRNDPSLFMLKQIMLDPRN
jgi:hypothetical protein